MALGSTGAQDCQVTGLSLSSQRVLPGDLYAALPGARVHGATYAPQAVAAGAVAIPTDAAGREPLSEVDEPVLVVGSPRGLRGSLAAQIPGTPPASLALFRVPPA